MNTLATNIVNSYNNAVKRVSSSTKIEDFVGMNSILKANEKISRMSDQLGEENLASSLKIYMQLTGETSEQLEEFAKSQGVASTAVNGFLLELEGKKAALDEYKKFISDVATYPSEKSKASTSSAKAMRNSEFDVRTLGMSDFDRQAAEYSKAWLEPYQNNIDKITSSIEELNSLIAVTTDKTQLEQYNQELEKYNMLLADAQQTYTKLLPSIQKHAKNLTGESEEIKKSVEVNTQLRSSLEDVFTTGITGFGSLDQSIKNMLQSLVQLLVKLYIVQPLLDKLGIKQGTFL